MKKQAIQTRSVTVLAILICSLALTTTPLLAQAPDSNGQSAVIIAHVPLSGPSATQMLLQKQGARLFLYADQGDKQGVAVVDVTNPGHPSVVDRATWPGRTADGQVQTIGSGLAISEQAEGALSRRPVSQTLNILDITDPQHPQVLQTFSGVTSVLPDAGRNLIFIANGEGLWIVRHRVGQGAYALRHLCTSEAALTPEPDCY